MGSPLNIAINTLHARLSEEYKAHTKTFRDLCVANEALLRIENIINNAESVDQDLVLMVLGVAQKALESDQ